MPPQHQLQFVVFLSNPLYASDEFLIHLDVFGLSTHLQRQTFLLILKRSAIGILQQIVICILRRTHQSMTNHEFLNYTPTPNDSERTNAAECDHSMTSLRVNEQCSWASHPQKEHIH